MKLAWITLLFALLPPLASAAATQPPPKHASKPTPLATITVTGHVLRNPRDTGVQAYGSASLQDTPATVTVIDRGQLDDAHVASLRQLVPLDASLGDSYAPVGYYDDISIRGYPLDLATGLRMNDLTIAGEQRIAMEDVQQVQILQGLAGIDAGVMEPGGVVNFVTKRPADVHTVTLGMDSHGSRYAALDLGDWLTPKFGVRANLASTDTHSYVQHADGRGSFASLAADWYITHRATLEFDGNFEDSEQRSVSGYQLLGGTVIPSHADPTRMLGFEPWQMPVRIHSTNTSVRFSYAFDDAWRLRLAAGHSRSEIDDNVAFAYGCFFDPVCQNGAPQTGAYFAPNGEYDVYDFRSPNETYSDNQARATLQGHFTLAGVSQDLTAGISVFHRATGGRNWVFDYVGTANIADPEPPYFPPSPSEPGPWVREFESWQHSVFALDRLHFGSHWQVFVGAHATRLSDQSWEMTGTFQGAARLTKIVPQAALLWQPAPTVTAYVSYSEGLSLGLQAPYWVSNAGDTLGPRLSRQVEAGAKYQWRHALDLGVALFRIHQPYQFAQPDDTAAGFTFVQRGNQVNTGIEVSANGRIDDDLTTHASISFIRAQAEDTGTPGYDGHQVQNVPPLRASLGVDYRLPALPQLSLLGTWRYAAPNVATPDGRVRVSAYNVFDVGLRYSTAWGRHAVVWRLAVDNLFDRFYWRDTGSSGGDSYLFPGAPRLARLSVGIDL
ncbi:MAG: TonB-dependent siderophore receptor [Rhodanobacteraceae bacterium]